MIAPDLPEDVTAAELDKDARGRLRTLSKDNAEDVGRHLVMAGRLLEEDPELAYRHAQTAVARAGRVDVVREAAAIAAYATGRYAEALREFRTVTRLNGSHEHLALVADCERGLGRPERALELAASTEAATLSSEAKAELQMVVAGARSDLGQFDAALLTLERIRAVDADQAARVREAHDAVVARRDGRGAAGHTEVGAPAAPESGMGVGLSSGEAPASAHISPGEDDEVVVYDLEDGDDD